MPVAARLSGMPRKPATTAKIARNQSGSVITFGLSCGVAWAAWSSWPARGGVALRAVAVPVVVGVPWARGRCPRNVTMKQRPM